MKYKTWQEGLEDELFFWRGWLRGKGKFYEKPSRLKDFFTPMIGNKKEVKIANIGSGPVCLIGDYRRDVKVKVESSDFLADEYQKLLDELNIKPLIPVKKQDMTNLTYDDNEFDIVYCSNALDHCHDPHKALKEMLRICKPGGWIYLFHIAHEGQRHNYRNLHKWNIDMTEDGDSVFWTKEKGSKTNTFLLSEIYPGFTTSLKPAPKSMLVTSIAQKNMDDLTIIYYTSNNNKEKFMTNTQKQLLKAVGNTPIITVSFKPTIIGNNCKNLCIGEQERSNFMIYLQILTGAREAQTKYVAMAEDDMFYHPSHFIHRPPDDKTFSYNINKWSIFSWVNPPFFSYRTTKLMNSLIAPKEALIKTLEERHVKYSLLKEKTEQIDKFFWSEPGRFESQMGITPVKSEGYRSQHPNVMFSTPEALGYEKLGYKKAHTNERADTIDYWGPAQKVLSYYA